MSKTHIKNVHARRVWNTQGHPTVEVEITLRYGAVGRAVAPIRALTHLPADEKAPAPDNFDLIAMIDHINGEVRSLLKGVRVDEQQEIDRRLLDLKDTDFFWHVGENILIAVSMAVQKAAAACEKLPLWQYLGTLQGESEANTLPLPEVPIFSRGPYFSRKVDVQDFMVIAVGASSYAEALEWTADVFRAARNIKRDSGLPIDNTLAGDERSAFENNEDVLETLTRAIEESGHRPGEDIAISLDVAASNFGFNGHYNMISNPELNSDHLSGMIIDWLARFPIVSITDPLGDDDQIGMVRFTWAVSKRTQVVGDQFFMPRSELIEHAAKDGACNAVQINPARSSTLSQCKALFNAAQVANFGSIIAAGANQTEHEMIMHLGVGWGVKQIKTAKFTQSGGTCVGNEGVRIAESIALSVGGSLPADGNLPPKSAFPWG